MSSQNELAHVRGDCLWKRQADDKRELRGKASCVECSELTRAWASSLYSMRVAWNAPSSPAPELALYTLCRAARSSCGLQPRGALGIGPERRAHPRLS